MKETVVDIHDGRFESRAAGDFDCIVVATVDELEAALRQAHKRWPAIVDIDISSFETVLTIDVDEHIGCILFGDRSGDPPYCMVVGNPEAPDGDFEFDVGGTPTPIPLRRCIPMEQLIDLVRYFYVHGEFPEGTEREED